MTIDEAIQRLIELRGELKEEKWLEKAQAVLLSIEALKAWQTHRFECHSVDDLLLPRETV